MQSKLLDTSHSTERMPQRTQQETYDFLMKMSMSYLEDQLSCVEYNDKNLKSKGILWYKKTFFEVYHTRKARGENAKKVRPQYAILRDGYDNVEVEIVKCGGKGQTMRVEHRF